MKASSPRRAAFAALVLAPALAACGFNAQTDQVYQPATGINDRDGAVDVLDALVVSGEDGSGTLSATLVNNSQSQRDQLTSVTGEGLTAETGGPIAVPAAGVVNLAESGDVALSGSAIKAGDFVSVTLVFANGQSTTMRIQVVRHEGDYADVPLPKPSESAKPTKKPTAESTPESTPSAE